MKGVILGLCVVFAIFVAGCTLGLTPEESSSVRKFHQQLGDKQVVYRALQTRIADLSVAIKEAVQGSDKWKDLLAQREEAESLAKAVVAEIKQLSDSIKELEDKGVPAWSVAVNVGERILLALFGGGGLLTGLITGMKNRKLKKVVDTVVDAVEYDVAGNVQEELKDSITARGIVNGSEKTLNDHLVSVGLADKEVEE